jgi:hypothetical protein
MHFEGAAHVAPRRTGSVVVDGFENLQEVALGIFLQSLGGFQDTQIASLQVFLQSLGGVYESSLSALRELIVYEKNRNEFIQEK